MFQQKKNQKKNQIKPSFLRNAINSCQQLLSVHAR